MFIEGLFSLWLMCSREGKPCELAAYEESLTMTIAPGNVDRSCIKPSRVTRQTNSSAVVDSASIAIDARRGDAFLVLERGKSRSYMRLLS